jgi:hypothetical protein
MVLIFSKYIWFTIEKTNFSVEQCYEGSGDSHSNGSRNGLGYGDVLETSGRGRGVYGAGRGDGTS